MNLDNIEGLTLTEEQKATILARAQAHTDGEVAGLKAKNDALMTEKKTAAEAAAAAEAVAKTAQEEADLEKARKANDLATLEQTLRDQFSDQSALSDAKLEALQEAVKNNRQNTVLSELSQHFLSPEAAKLVLKQLVNVNLGDDNSLSEEFVGFDGAVVATNPKQFIEWAGKNDNLATLMKPIESAGGGAGGSDGDAGGDAQQESRADVLYK